MGRPLDADGNDVFLEYPKRLPDGRVVTSREDEDGLVYPKRVTVGGDHPVTVLVKDEADEARWRESEQAPDAPSEPAEAAPEPEPVEKPKKKKKAAPKKK